MGDPESLNPKLADREDALSAEEDGADSQLPVVERGCTDLFCLLIFVLYVMGMGGLSVLGYYNGDPSRLIYATNYKGELCGGELHPEEKFIVYPRANEDVAASGFLTDPSSKVSFFGVCVRSCPQAGEYVCTDEGEAGVTAALVNSTTKNRDQVIQECLALPVYSSLTCDNKEVFRGCFDTIVDTTNIFQRCLPDYVYESELLPESGCVRFKNISTSEGVKQTCVVYKEVTKVTREQPTAGNLLFDTFNTYYRYAQTLFGDIVKAWKPILGSALGVTTAAGLLYVLSLRCCVGLVVWVTVFGTLISSILFTVFCYIKAGIITSDVINQVYSKTAEFFNTAGEKLTETSSDLFELDTSGNSSSFEFTQVNASEVPPAFTASLEYTTEFEYMAYALTGFSVLLFLIVVSLFDKIVRAIEIFEVASKAIQKNMALVVLPFVSTFVSTAAISAWALSTAYIASAGSFELNVKNGTGVVLDAEDNVVSFGELAEFDYGDLMVLYMFFGIIWILNFINGITIMTVGGAVLQWFWNSEVAEGKTGQSTRLAIFRSFGRTVRYHLGTVALGSFILAFIQFIRYMAAFLQRRLNSMGKDSRVVKILCCAAQCFLLCVQKCIEFIQRNAFIWSAMYGTSFMTSARSSFFAVTSNIALVAMVTFLGDIIQRFGQILIMLVSGLAAWLWLDSDPRFAFGGEFQLSSFVWPVLVTMFIAWFIAAEILTVYDVTVDTILLSYVQDKRLKKFKADHQERSPEELSDFMSKHKLEDPKLIRQASFNTFN